MAGLGIVIPRAGGTGPIVTPLHTAGVDGYSRRFVASRLAGAAGTALTAWPDQVDPSKSMSATFSTVVDTANGKAVRVAPQARLSFPEIIDSPVTVVVVGVITELGRPFIRAAGIDVNRTSAANVAQINGMSGGAGAGTGYVSVPATNGLSAVIAVLSDTAPALRWNGADSSTIVGSYASSTAVSDATTNGLISSSFSTGNYDYLECIVYPRALTAIERASVYTAMKAKYPAIA